VARPTSRLPFAQLFETERLLALGVSHSALETQLNKLFGVGAARTRSLVEAVYDAWANSPEVLATREQRRTLHVERLRMLWLKALETKNLAVACRVEDMLLRVEGLYAPVQLEATTTQSAIGEISPDRIRENLSELIKRHPEYHPNAKASA
jgi:hypothetical protein